jgi:hypothetical protein
MMTRAEVERAILDEESMLEHCARLLEGRARLAAWPADVRAALALALDDASMSSTERWKAVVLHRHLFGPTAIDVPDELIAPSAPATIDRARSERLRAALPARVRYRIATYLLPAH